MIRLTPYLKDSHNSAGSITKDSTGKQVEALNRVISVLMQGIALHGLQFEETSFHAFQDAVWKMRAGFEHAGDEDSALLLAGAVIRLLEEHNEAAQVHLRARHAEMAGLVGLAFETLLEVTHASPQATARVRGISQEVTRASSLTALAMVKPRFEVALAEMRAKAQLPAAVAGAASLPAGGTDAVTGLPDAGSAVEAIAGIWQRRGDQYVAMFALEYLETINQRFGFRTGDELLSQLSQHVGQNIAAHDQLFRWRGPCLLAVVNRSLPESMVATEMGRIVPTRLECATHVGEREAMVRVSTSWALMRLQDIGTLDEAIARLNEFAGNRSRFVRHVSAGA